MEHPRSSAYLPAPPLGAVQSVPPSAPLTPVVSADAARAALRAEAATSVLDPVSLRRLWVRELDPLIVVAVMVVLGVTASMAWLNGEERLPRWWLILNLFLSIIITINVRGYVPAALVRALPVPELIPPFGPARLRWYQQLHQQPAVVPSPAQWPPGAEAYALLSGAATVQSVAPSWLCERVALPADVGAHWVAALRWQGLLAGGGRRLGLSRLPELHLHITDAGRERLEAERSRFITLAGNDGRPRASTEASDSGTPSVGRPRSRCRASKAR